MTFNGSNVIAENVNKSGKIILSRSLIPINEVFDNQNHFGKSNCEQMFKTAPK